MQTGEMQRATQPWGRPASRNAHPAPTVFVPTLPSPTSRRLEVDSRPPDQSGTIAGGGSAVASLPRPLGVRLHFNEVASDT